MTKVIETLVAAYALLGVVLIAWKASWFFKIRGDHYVQRLGRALGWDILSEAYNIGVVFVFTVIALYGESDSEFVSQDVKVFVHFSMVTAALITTLNVYRCFRESSNDRVSPPPR